MAFFNWNETYSVGVRLYDMHHRRLIAIINQLYTAMSTDKDDQELNLIFDNLLEYSTFHFSSEEKQLYHYEYPGYLKHFKEHETMKRRVVEYQFKMQNGDLGTSEEVAGCLKDWVANHILVEDKKYEPFLQAMCHR